MSTLETVLLVLQLVLAVSLISVILFQRTAQDGGGLVGGGSTMGGLFTARGSANLLTHATAFLATAFMINSLALGFITSSEHQSKGEIDQIESPVAVKKAEPASKDAGTAAPEVPTGAPVTSPAAPANPQMNMSTPAVTPPGANAPPLPTTEPEVPNVPTPGEGK